MSVLRLPFVHRFRDRHGKVRHYFRRIGFNQTPLPGIPGSQEFMSAYQAALAGEAACVAIGAKRTRPGTVNAVVVGYYESLAFRCLAPGTQAMRRAILERFRSDHGEKRLDALPREFIVRTLSKRSPAAARNWLKALRGLLQFAVAEGFRNDDPSADVSLPPLKSDGIRTWTETEIAQFEAKHEIGTRARLALALLLFTGQRRGDVVNLGRQHIRDGILHVRQQKTGAALAIPVHRDLQTVIEATLGGHLTFLVTDSGKPFSPAGFGNWFRECCEVAGLPKGCSAHGLRKAACRRLAEAGCSTHQIASISGHRSLGEVQRYTRAADQARLAREAIGTVEKVFGASETRTANGKPDR